VGGVGAINGEPEQRDPSATSCRPCRGTGRLSSTLGGERHEVICPWCRGTGESIPGIDAQEAPAEGGAQEASTEGGAQEAAALGGARAPED